jgi:predicted P-loop ATPase
MKKAEVEQIKSLLGRQVDRARPAYGRVREDRKRRSIEWGTTNSKKYLQSQTGNRRFWPLEVGKIDIEALKRDRLQLLGEAAAYEAEGESVTLDESLWPAALEAQDERRVTDPWEEILSDIPQTIKIWKKDKKRDDGDDERPELEDEIQIIHHDERGKEKVSSKDLLDHILKIPPARQTRFDTMRLADVMRMIGWSRSSNGKVNIEHKQVQGYWREKVEEEM